MKLIMLLSTIQTNSKTIYPKALEGKIGYNPDPPVKVENIAAKYKYWHQYLTTNLHVTVFELLFP